MSLISQIINGLSGNDENKTVTLPCSNCESSCGVYPKACEECKPYKTRLIDALYNVEHIDAFYDRYEIIAEGSAPAGTTECPVCGAPASGAVCEYCGSRIAEANGKIQVSSASEIPNPIIEARNIIYERRSVIDKYTGSSDSSSTGILGSIVSALTGADKDECSLGTAMTESEIKAMAAKYGVSVKDYLEGLDAGTYLTKTAYESRETLSSQSSSASAGAGVALGAAGIGSAIGMLSGSSHGHRPPQPAPRPPQQHMGGNGMKPQQGNRPPMGNQGQFRRDSDIHQGSRPSGHGSGGGRPGHGGHGQNGHGQGGGRGKK